ncbi:MAG: DUF4823 domain-containing protein [Hypericibacter sp.]
MAALMLSLSLAGCASKYRVDAYEAPAAQLDKQSSFYVVLPEDGRYGATVYPGSGATTAQAVASALLIHVDKAVIGTTAGEDLNAALAQAQQRDLSYVFVTTILNWEDRATEWSGIPDKLTLKYAVYEAPSGKLVSSTVTSASSKWGTMGGDHPQDLLPEPTRKFVDPLF